MNRTMEATTYAEACAHAEANCRRTNGMIRGGGYWIESEDGDIYHVDLRVGANGIARPTNVSLTGGEA